MNNQMQEILSLVHSGTINPNHVYLKPEQVEELGNGTPKAHTLAVWRSTGRQELKACRIGRMVRYRLSDVLAFLEKSAGE